MISQSKFYMFRTLYSLLHADNIITDEELDFMKNVLEDVELSDEQSDIFYDDIKNPKDAVEMFKGITDDSDKSAFFSFAYDLVLTDGNYHTKEYKVIKSLQSLYDKENGKEVDTDEIDLVLEQRSGTSKKNVSEVMEEFKEYL